MRDGVRALVEVVGIELAYARAEIAVLPRMGDEKIRIAGHLEAASRTLDQLLIAADELELVGGARRLTRKHVARLRTAKSHVRNASRFKLAGG